jgi:hypothetical protein
VAEHIEPLTREHLDECAHLIVATFNAAISFRKVGSSIRAPCMTSSEILRLFLAIFFSYR